MLLYPTLQNKMFAMLLQTSNKIATMLKFVEFTAGRL